MRRPWDWLVVLVAVVVTAFFALAVGWPRRLTLNRPLTFAAVVAGLLLALVVYGT
jgi:CHASE2 domain-containing sensor protein